MMLLGTDRGGLVCHQNFDKACVCLCARRVCVCVQGVCVCVRVCGLSCPHDLFTAARDHTLPTSAYVCARDNTVLTAAGCAGGGHAARAVRHGQARGQAPHAEAVSFVFRRNQWRWSFATPLTSCRVQRARHVILRRQKVECAGSEVKWGSAVVLGRAGKSTDVRFRNPFRKGRWIL
eukprot:1204821-Rhodomonas_salina.2